MKTKDIAPCGINCSLCLGYQRTKNHCNGCNGSDEHKAYHCVECRIKNCEKKHGKKDKFCYECKQYPCRLIRNLEKRYRTRYNIRIYENFKNIKDLGIREFIKREKVIWKCTGCEQYVCMHREKCLFCGAINHMYIRKDDNLTTASTL